jgi:CubicO group peptidase (beta-lactamase class C family)
VHTGGPDLRPVTVPATEPVRVWHLLTHTAGLSYGFHRVHPVDAIYRAAGFEWATPPAVDLAQACDIWAGMPLLFDPGSEWNYSVATDILGRIIEVVSGQKLDEFLAARILRPLGMSDTSFWVGDGDAGRLAALYTPGTDGTAVRMDALGNAARERPAMLSGGAGLVSTAADYHRFTQMLLHRADSPAGELDGIRLLGPARSATWPATIFPAASICTRSAGRSTRSSRSTGSASASGSPWSPTRPRPRWSARLGSFPAAAPPAPRSGSTRGSS